MNVGGRASRTQFQYTLQDANIDELNTWAPKLLEKLKTLPDLRDVATDQQMAGTTLTSTSTAIRPRASGSPPMQIDATLYDAFGQRQMAQYFTQQNSYHVIMEVLPSIQGDPQKPRQALHPRRRRPAGLVPLATFASGRRATAKPLSISHQGQFPAVTISFNLAQGVALGTATNAIKAAERELRLPALDETTFQGNAQAFQAIALDGADADRARRSSSST